MWPRMGEMWSGDAKIRVEYWVKIRCFGVPWNSVFTQSLKTLQGNFRRKNLIRLGTNVTWNYLEILGDAMDYVGMRI